MKPSDKPTKQRKAILLIIIGVLLVLAALFAVLGGSSGKSSSKETDYTSYRGNRFTVSVLKGYTSSVDLTSKISTLKYPKDKLPAYEITVQRYLNTAKLADLNAIKEVYKKDSSIKIIDYPEKESVKFSLQRNNSLITYINKDSSIWKISLNFTKENGQFKNILDQTVESLAVEPQYYGETPQEEPSN